VTSRERVIAALSHEQPDFVPLDLGGTRDSSIVLEGYERLKRHFGIASKSVIWSRMLGAVRVDEAILRELCIDTRGIGLGTSTVQGDTETGENSYRDYWGIERVKLEDSYYYDIGRSPLSGDITRSDILKYQWPDPDDVEFYRDLIPQVRWFRENTDCAVVFSVPSAFVHVSQYIRGFEDWYCYFEVGTELLELLFDCILDINIRITEKALKEIGQEVDVVACADDLGTQRGLQISREHYKKYIKPRHARYFQQIHDMSSAKLLFHSCGSIADILEDLIEIGVDAVNPVQVSAAGMDPAGLKKEYGGRLAFWGAIDSQRVLPTGSISDVKKSVEETIEHLGEGGGYILSAVHNIQPDVPLGNILAMFGHAREYVPTFSRRPPENRALPCR
jgi:uroporphyrinogen decarboxylase